MVALRLPWESMGRPGWSPLGTHRTQSWSESLESYNGGSVWEGSQILEQWKTGIVLREIPIPSENQYQYQYRQLKWKPACQVRLCPSLLGPHTLCSCYAMPVSWEKMERASDEHSAELTSNPNWWPTLWNRAHIYNHDPYRLLSAKKLYWAVILPTVLSKITSTC